MTTEQRMERLERQNQRLQLAVGGMLALAVAALIMGQAAPREREVIPNVLRAHRIEVVSAEGKPAVVLGMTAGGTGTVTTLDKGQTQIITLGATKNDEGTITTNNKKGKELVKIGVTTEGEGVLITQNTLGEKLVEIGPTVKNDPKITIYRQDGTIKAQWP